MMFVVVFFLFGKKKGAPVFEMDSSCFAAYGGPRNPSAEAKHARHASFPDFHLTAPWGYDPCCVLAAKCHHSKAKLFMYKLPY